MRKRVDSVHFSDDLKAFYVETNSVITYRWKLDEYRNIIIFYEIADACNSLYML